MISNRVIMGASGNVPSSNVKSVIFDIADNYGAALIGIRSIEFLASSSVIPMVGNYTAYATTITTPTIDYEPSFAFNTTLSKTGVREDTSWLADSDTNQRLIIVFDTIQAFDEIVINNGHTSGVATNSGAQNVKITVSPNIVTDTTYNAGVIGGTVLNNTAWPQHVASDTIDNQTVWTQP